MKRIITFILAISFICAACCSFTGCDKEIELTAENAKDCLFVNVTFSNVEILKHEETGIKKFSHGYGTIDFDGRYYIYCMATITVNSKGDYLFKNAKCTLRTSWEQYWHFTYSEHADKSCVVDGTTYFSAAPYWQGTIQLDKNGYGSMTVFLYKEASESYIGEHPISENNKPWIYSASGTVIEN